jgi:hypothetical protein
MIFYLIIGCVAIVSVTVVALILRGRIDPKLHPEDYDN